MSIRYQLHQVRFRLRYKTLKVHSRRNNKRCGFQINGPLTGTSRIPIILKLTGWTEWECRDIIDIWVDDFDSSQCNCQCHEEADTETAAFHTQDCLEDCEEDNEDFIQFLMEKVHPLYVWTCKLHKRHARIIFFIHQTVFNMNNDLQEWHF